MQATDPAHATGRSGPESGWVTFAGVVFLIAGIANLVWGWGALAKKSYLSEAGLIYSTLSTWGWIAVVWGVIVLIGAALLLSRSSAGPGVGIVLAIVSCLFWFLVLPALPVFAAMAILVDLLVVYGLAMHGFAAGD